MLGFILGNPIGTFGGLQAPQNRAQGDFARGQRWAYKLPPAERFHRAARRVPTARR
jgi:hypothetical protein